MTSGTSTEQGAFSGRTMMMVLRRLLVALKSRWWIPLVTMSLATVAAAFYVAQMPPPMYVSVARMWVAGKTKIPEGAAYVEEANSFYGTQSELMQSKTIVGRAHSRVAAQHPDLKFIPVSLKVGKAPQAAIFILQASGQDQTYPRLFLEALMDEFLQFKREAKSESSEGTLAQVSQQKFKAEEDLKTAQARLEEYQRERPLAVMQEDETLARANFARWNRELTDKKVDLELLEQMIKLGEMPDQKKARVSAEEGATESRTAVDINEPRDKDYHSVAQRIETLKIQREELSEFLKPAHPKIVALDLAIQTAEKMLNIYRGQGREDLLKSREGLKVKIASLEVNVAKAKDEVQRTARILQEAAKLAAAVGQAQRTVDGLNSIVRSVDMGAGLDQDNLQILENASTASAPPLQKLPPVIGGAFFGMLLGLGIVLMLVWFDDRLGSLAELRANVDCLVVGQVPELEMKKGETRVHLLEPDDHRHHFAESYRNIRSSLLFMATEGVRPKTILITSSVPAEGKSTVSSNLARAMAFTGSKVLLIEGDQRRGQLHDLFGIPSEPGLAEVLRGELPLSEVIRTTNLENLSFISRGRPPRNPGELFLGTNMDRLLQDVYNEYDYILIDSAPVLAADDTTSLAPKMDGVLFVVRNSYTSAKLLRQSLDLLEQRQVRILGVIYNRADVRGGDYNYYNYPQYYIAPTSESAAKQPNAAANDLDGINGDPKLVNGSTESETKFRAKETGETKFKTKETGETKFRSKDGGETKFKSKPPRKVSMNGEVVDPGAESEGKEQAPADPAAKA